MKKLVAVFVVLVIALSGFAVYAHALSTRNDLNDLADSSGYDYEVWHYEETFTFRRFNYTVRLETVGECPSKLYVYDDFGFNMGNAPSEALSYSGTAKEHQFNPDATEWWLDGHRVYFTETELNDLIDALGMKDLRCEWEDYIDELGELNLYAWARYHGLTVLDTTNSFCLFRPTSGDSVTFPMIYIGKDKDKEHGLVVDSISVQYSRNESAKEIVKYEDYCEPCCSYDGHEIPYGIMKKLQTVINTIY